MQDRRDGEIVNIRREEGPLYVHRIKGVFNIKRKEGSKKADIFHGWPGLGFVSCVRYDITFVLHNESGRPGEEGLFKHSDSIWSFK